jgi:hypothetical protein
MPSHCCCPGGVAPEDKEEHTLVPLLDHLHAVTASLQEDAVAFVTSGTIGGRLEVLIRL